MPRARCLDRPTLSSSSAASALALLLLACKPATPDPGAQEAGRAGEPPAPAGAPTQPPDPSPDPSPAPSPDPSPDPSAPIVYLVGDAVAQIELDGGDKQTLLTGLGPDGVAYGGAIGHGASGLTVSPDRRRLAWLAGVDLWVAELGGASPSKTAITAMPAATDGGILAAEISFSTWSPDSQALVVVLAEPSYADEDPLPLPDGLAYGFHVLRSGDLRLTPAPQIEGFYGWTPDSERVLDNKYLAHNSYELRAVPIAGGEVEVVRTAADGYGFSQLDVAGSYYTWVASPESGSQVMVAAVAGGEAKPMTPLGKFSEYAWPRVAPDGARVLVRHDGKPQLSAGADADATALPEGELRWHDPGHLVGVSPAGLVVVDLDGATTVLDPAATGLPRR